MDTKIKVDTIKMWDMVQNFTSGDYRIPRFQRDYVWDKGKVIKLLNSIYQEYPIGTFFLWRAAKEYHHLYRDIPELHTPSLKDKESYYFILDGQQRMTSLVVAVLGLRIQYTDSKGHEKAIDYSQLSFDLDRQEFTSRAADNDRFVSVAAILDPSKNMKLVRTLREDRAAIFQRCYQTFSTYPLSLVYVLDQNLQHASEIFERINQGGVRLSVFDLVVASTWANDFDLKEEVQELNEKMEAKSFGAIDPEFILQTLSLILKGQATRAAQLDIKSSELKEVWPEAVRAIESAVDYMRNSLGVKIYKFLPSRNMLPMVAYFFYHADGRSLSPAQASFLEEWFWKCAFSEHYSGTTSTAMLEDKKQLIDLVLEGQRVEVNFPIHLTAQGIKYAKLYGTSSIKNGIVCLLAQLSPKHFVNNTPVTLDGSELSDFNSPERHHIFPKKMVQGDTFQNSIANFCFIPAELNKEISASSPSRYLGQFKAKNPSLTKTLETHLITAEPESGLWVDDFHLFINQRSEALYQAISEKVGKIAPIEVELSKTPEKVVDSIEQSLRQVIDAELRGFYGDAYWKENIPGDIQDNVKKRLASHETKYPSKSKMTSVDLLSFCNLPEYNNIIAKHWKIFEDMFHSKPELERNFMYLSDYRNAIKHTRALTSIEKKHGEAAAEWFDGIIKASSKQLQPDI